MPLFFMFVFNDDFRSQFSDFTLAICNGQHVCAFLFLSSLSMSFPLPLVSKAKTRGPIPLHSSFLP